MSKGPSAEQVAAFHRANVLLEEGRFEEAIYALAAGGLLDVRVDPATGEKQYRMPEKHAAMIRRILAAQP
jgi:hypothetical protein